MIVKKVCKRCGRNRKIGKFGVLSSKPDSKNIYCRDCMKEIRSKYNGTIKGTLLNKQCIDNWKRNNKDEIKEYNKQYYLKNKSRILYNKKCLENKKENLLIERCTTQKKINKDRKECEIVINPKRKE